MYQQQPNHIKADLDHHQDTQEISNNNLNNSNKTSNTYNKQQQQEETDILKDFAVSKSDPKYQTLPYNTKFTVNIIPNRANGKNQTDLNDNADVKDFESTNHISNHLNANVQSHCHTVHSAPLSVINKNIATPLNQNDLISRKSAESGKDQFLDCRNAQNGVSNNKLVENSGPISSTGNSSGPLPYQVSKFKKLILIFCF